MDVADFGDEPPRLIKKTITEARSVLRGSFSYDDLEFDEWTYVLRKPDGKEDTYHILILPIDPKGAKESGVESSAVTIIEHDGSYRYNVDRNETESVKQRIKINGQAFEVTCRYKEGVLDTSVIPEGDVSTVSAEVGSLHTENENSPGHPVIKEAGRKIHIFPIPHVFEYALPEAVICIESDKAKKIFAQRNKGDEVNINVAENITLILEGAYDENEDFYTYNTTATKRTNNKLWML